MNLIAQKTEITKAIPDGSSLVHMLMPICSLTDVIVLMLLEILYQNKKQLFSNSMVMAAALHLSQARFDTFAPPGGANVSNLAWEHAWGTPLSRVTRRECEWRHRGDGARGPTRAKISGDVLAMKKTCSGGVGCRCRTCGPTRKHTRDALTNLQGSNPDFCRIFAVASGKNRGIIGAI